jgi:hypothetical protein
MAAVLEALRSGHGLAAPDIARRYAQGMKAVPRIEATLAALARLGYGSIERNGYRLWQACNSTWLGIGFRKLGGYSDSCA